MKKEMKNWNGTIELRPHWSSHTQAPKIVRNRRQRPDARSSSSSSGQVFKVVKVVKLALPEPRPRQVFRVYTYTWYTQAPKSPPGAPEALPASSQHAAQQSLYVCRCVADASQRLDVRPSFEGIHLYMVYTGIASSIRVSLPLRFTRVRFSATARIKSLSAVLTLPQKHRYSDSK